MKKTVLLLILNLLLFTFTNVFPIEDSRAEEPPSFENIQIEHCNISENYSDIQPDFSLYRETETNFVTDENVLPSANFTYEPSIPTTADIVYFNDTSSVSNGSIVNWTWDFGDGNVCYDQNVTSNYSDNGSYIANLTVKDAGGATDWLENIVNVSNVPPVTNFTIEPANPTNYNDEANSSREPLPANLSRPVFAKSYEDNFIINVPQIFFDNQNDITFISIEGYGSTTDSYKPSLPTKTFYFGIPSNAEDVTVSLNQIESQIFNNIENVYEILPPMPANNDPNYIPPARVQDSNTRFPENNYKYNGIKNLNDYKLISITIYPVNYYHNDKKIEYSNLYNFAVYYNLNGNTEQYPRKINSPIEALASEITLNYDEIENKIQKNFATAFDTVSASGTNIKYAIITTSSLEDYLIPLKDWKIKKGVPAEIYLTSDIYSGNSGIDNAEKIRNFLISLESSDDIDWVLLAGDVADVPTRNAYCDDTYDSDGDYVPTDYYYADLEGSYSPYDWDKDNDGKFGENEDDIDWLPEVYVGRLSTSSTSKMQTLVNRIINYEKDPDSGSWTNKVILAGSKSDDHTDDALLMEYIKNDFLSGNMNYERLYYLTNYVRDYSLSFSNFQSRVGTGASLVNWAGHGSYTSAVVSQSGSAFVSTSTNPSNNDKRPLVYADSCNTGAFDQTTSLGEDIIRDWGIGFVGASRVSWYIRGWPGPSFGYNHAHDYKFFKQLLFYEKYQPGKALYDSKVDYINDFSSPYDSLTVQEMKNLFDYNLLGDPEINIWTNTPDSFDVTYPSTLTKGSSSFTVHVEDNGMDVADAYVCLSKDDEVYSRGYTNSNGDVTFTPSPSTFGTMYVTITKHNYIPHEGEALIVDDYESDDDYSEANWIETDNTNQFHNFHVSGDHDWVKFNATSQYNYVIETSDLGPNSDTYLYLYDTDGSTILSYDDDSGEGNYASRIEWACPSNGVYYGMVKHYSDSKSGPNTYYNLAISIENYPPTADFTYLPANPNTDDTIQFTDTSIDIDGNIAAWDWDFGDDNTSTNQNPTKQYSIPGTYNITLSVTDDDGATNETSQQITVRDWPAANFAYIPVNPNTDNNIQFTDTSTDIDGSIDNWFWDFGDENTSTNQNPNHQYTIGNTYTVTLNVTDNDGLTNEISKQIIVNVVPTASFSYNPINPYTSNNISFTDTSTDTYGPIISWSWNFGDGNTSTNQNPTHQYGDDGTYTVSLNVTDEYSIQNETSVQITVLNVEPISNFTYSPSNPTDIQTIIFTDTSTDSDGTIVNYTWDFGDSNTSTNQNPTHQYTDDGTYNATLTVTDDDGALDVKNTLITVLNVQPSANFTIEPIRPTIQDTVYLNDTSSDSDGTIESYEWDFGDGSDRVYTQNTTHLYTTDETYTVTLTVTDDDGAIHNKTMSIRVTVVADVIVDNNAPPSWYDNTHVKTIQEGINNATENDTIYVYNGTYYENVNLNKTVDITGRDKNSTIIDGNGNDDVLFVTAHRANITGFTIQNSGTSAYDAGIDISPVWSYYYNITNNIIKNNSKGIYYNSSSGCSISQNLIINSNDTAIYLDDSSNNNINENTVTNNSIGIYLYYGSNNNINNNTVINNELAGILLVLSSSNTITENTVINTSHGVYLAYTYSNSITNNLISNHDTLGIYIWGDSQENTIYRNNIKNCSRGIRIAGTASDNLIYQNSFVNNTNLSQDYCSNEWNNAYPTGGNYWDDYNGTDSYSGSNQNISGSDNIGDTPYNISNGDNQDNYPLMYPSEYYFTLKISSPSETNENTDFTVTIKTLVNVIIENASVTFNSQTKTTDSNGQATFTAPSVSTNTDYVIATTKTSYTGNTTTITVKNVESSGGGNPSGGGGGPTQPSTPDSTNNPPNADAGGPYSGYTNSTITFDASGSNDDDGTIILYDWDFGDGHTGSGETTTHSYQTFGNYTITLTVTDNDSDADTDTTYAIIIEQNETGEVNDTTNSTNLKTIYINDIEYNLIDEDEDEIYDVICCVSNGKLTTVKLEDANYLIDLDGDGNWDYMFDPASESVTSLADEKLEKESGNINLPLIMLAGLFIAAIAAIVVYYKRKHIFALSDNKSFSSGLVDQINTASEIIQKNLLLGEEKKQYQLLKAMYAEDIESKYILEKLSVSMDELEVLVDTLVEKGLLHYVSDDEAKITEKGIKYIKSRDS